jgi:predicted ATPase
VELLERDEALAELHRQFERSATHGRLVVVSGEAGIGKTALVSHFLGECVPTPVVLWGRCDPLHTPRPLGPIRDAARDAGGRLATVLAEDAARPVPRHAAQHPPGVRPDRRRLPRGRRARAPVSVKIAAGRKAA